MGSVVGDSFVFPSAPWQNFSGPAGERRELTRNNKYSCKQSAMCYMLSAIF